MNAGGVAGLGTAKAETSHKHNAHDVFRQSGKQHRNLTSRMSSHLQRNITRTRVSIGDMMLPLQLPSASESDSEDDSADEAPEMTICFGGEQTVLSPGYGQVRG